MKYCRLFCVWLALAGLCLTPAVRAQPAAAPPPAPAESHEFDFWIGDWDVYAFGTDTIIGENRIESVSGGRALLENWTANPAFGIQTGKSLNSYDVRSGQWQQYWVGSGGAITLYKGGMTEGKMVMIAESFTAKGAAYLTRGTWSPQPDGSVRQQFETSNDGGKTWQPGFDGHYKRKPKS